MTKNQTKVIRIREFDFERLKKFATPLSDTPADVISRLISMAEQLKKNKDNLFQKGKEET